MECKRLKELSEIFSFPFHLRYNEGNEKEVEAHVKSRKNQAG